MFLLGNFIWQQNGIQHQTEKYYMNGNWGKKKKKEKKCVLEGIIKEIEYMSPCQWIPVLLTVVHEKNLKNV